MKAPWVMPEWMEQYRELFNWKDIEKAVNSATSDAEKIVSGQVLMLAILHGRKLLHSMPKDKALAHKNDPQTSHDAAKTVNLDLHRAAILAAVASRKEGIIYEDLFALLKENLGDRITYGGMGTRLVTLVRRGLIEDTGRKGVTKAGNRASILMATDRGRELLQAYNAAAAVAAEMNQGLSQ